MSGHPVALDELRCRLDEVNSQYRWLVRNSKEAGRLARMIKLRDERLDLTSRILAAERSDRTQ